MSQINTIHNFQPSFAKGYFNMVLQITPRSSDWSRLSTLSNQNFVLISHLPYARYMAFPSHSPLYDHPNNNW
jgi:hypothetical protein